MSKNYKALLVDDEQLANEALKLILNEFKNIDIIGECLNGYEAVKQIQSLKPDIVFLDIQMPKLNGFDVVELLGNELPLIVFITAYDEYALKAFDTHAIDYLLKPVSRERMEKTLNKIDHLLTTNYKIPISELISDRQNTYTPITRILVREGSSVQIVPTNEVVYIEAQDDYVSISTTKSSYLKHERISRLEELLDQTIFCRIHRSFIINVNFLSKIEQSTKESKIAILKNKKSFPISKTGYSKLAQFL